MVIVKALDLIIPIKYYVFIGLLIFGISFFSEDRIDTFVSILLPAKCYLSFRQIRSTDYQFKSVVYFIHSNRIILSILSLIKP